MRSAGLVLLTCLVLLPACGDSVAGPASNPVLLRLTADDQVVTAGDSLPLEVRLTDRGVGLAGRTVTWAVHGAGIITPTSVTSDAGIAVAVLRAGPGDNRVIVRADRVADETTYAIHGCDGCSDWRSVGIPQAGRAWASAQTLDGLIWIVGGETSLGATDAVDVFDPATDRLRPATRLPLAIGGATAVAAHGRLYVIGGHQAEWDALGMRTVLAFDPAAGTWHAGADMATGRFLAAGAVLDGKIYVVGGHDACDWVDGYCADGPLASVAVYDPATDRWTDGPPLREARALAGAAVLDGRLYVAGGSTGSDWWYDEPLASVEMLDPAAGRWQARAPLPVPGPVHLAVADGGMHAFVWSELQLLSRVYRYDPQADRWTRLRNAPGLVGPAVAAAGDRVYAFGGFLVDLSDRWARDASHWAYVLDH